MSSPSTTPGEFLTGSGTRHATEGATGHVCWNTVFDISNKLDSHISRFNESFVLCDSDSITNAIKIRVTHEHCFDVYPTIDWCEQEGYRCFEVGITDWKKKLDKTYSELPSMIKDRREALRDEKFVSSIREAYCRALRGDHIGINCTSGSWRR